VQKHCTRNRFRSCKAKRDTGNQALRNVLLELVLPPCALLAPFFARLPPEEAATAPPDSASSSARPLARRCFISESALLRSAAVLRRFWEACLGRSLSESSSSLALLPAKAHTPSSQQSPNQWCLPTILLGHQTHIHRKNTGSFDPVPSHGYCREEIVMADPEYRAEEFMLCQVHRCSCCGLVSHTFVLFGLIF
jgi:hypothetical protein